MPMLKLVLILTLAQSPQTPVVCVQFRSLDEIHWTAGVPTVSKLPRKPEDPSMHFLWRGQERSLHVFRDGKWTKVEESDYAYSRKPCSDPPWYVPVSQRLREQRWVEKVKGKQ